MHLYYFVFVYLSKCISVFATLKEGDKQALEGSRDFTLIKIPGFLKMNSRDAKSRWLHLCDFPALCVSNGLHF